MNITAEFILLLVVNILTAGICIGIYKATLSFIQKQIEELKTSQAKYNNYLERLIKVEQSVKALWHQVDEK